MKKLKRPVRFTGQHFTVDTVLIADAIKTANIQPHDTVFDIGAGKGSLTIHLARCCKEVVAIENDRQLLEILRSRFARYHHIKIIGADFRNYKIPDKHFKVVSNIPYRITANILNSLMFEKVDFFLGGSIIMQKEAAQKFFSKKMSNPYMVFYHTFFDFQLICEIGPKSFLPPPGVRSALLKIQRKQSIVPTAQKTSYIYFLLKMLQKPEVSVKTALKSIFRKRQMNALITKYGIDLNNVVTALSATQWSACFMEMLKKVPEKYHPAV